MNGGGNQDSSAHFHSSVVGGGGRSSTQSYGADHNGYAPPPTPRLGLKQSKSYHRLPPKKRRRLQKRSNGLNDRDILSKLVDQVSRQETMIDFLVDKVECLEQCSYQTQLILSRVQSQLFGISKQLGKLGESESAGAFHHDSVKPGFSAANRIEFELSDEASSEPSQVKYHLTRKRPFSSKLHSKLTSEESDDRDEVRYSSTPSSSEDCSKEPNHIQHDLTEHENYPSIPAHSPASSHASGLSVCTWTEEEDNQVDAHQGVMKSSSKETPSQFESSSSSPLKYPIRSRSSDAVVETSERDASLPHEAPAATPIFLRSSNVLPSSVIDKSSLISVDAVLQSYLGRQLHYVGQKLASLAIFGEKVMCMCSPLGNSKHYPALPQEELYMLKQILLDAYPQYWNDLREFEVMWKKTLGCIATECCRLRRLKAADSVKEVVEWKA